MALRMARAHAVMGAKLGSMFPEGSVPENKVKSTASSRSVTSPGFHVS